MGFFLGNRFAKSPMGQMLGIKGPSGALRVVDPSGKLIGSVPRGFSADPGSVIKYTGTGGDTLRGIYRGRQRGGLFGNFAPGDTFSHAEGGDVVRKSVRQAMGMDNETGSTGSTYGTANEAAENDLQGAFDNKPDPAPVDAFPEVDRSRLNQKEEPNRVSPSLSEERPDLYPGDNVSQEAAEQAEAAERAKSGLPAYDGLPIKQEPPLQQAQEAPPPQIVDQAGGPLDELLGYQDPTELSISPMEKALEPYIIDSPKVSSANDEWADVKAEYAQGHTHAHANTGGMEMEITPPPVHGDPADVKPVEFGPETMIPVPGSPRALKEGAVNEFVTPSGRKVPGQYKGGDPSKFENWKRLESGPSSFEQALAPYIGAEAEIPVSPPPRPGAPAGMTELPQAPQFNATGSVEYDYPIANAQVQYPGPTPPMPDRKPSQNPFFAEGDPSMPTRNPQRGTAQEAVPNVTQYEGYGQSGINPYTGEPKSVELIAFERLSPREQNAVLHTILHESNDPNSTVEERSGVFKTIMRRYMNSTESMESNLTAPHFTGQKNPMKNWSKHDGRPYTTDELMKARQSVYFDVPVGAEGINQYLNIDATKQLYGRLPSWAKDANIKLGRQNYGNIENSNRSNKSKNWERIPVEAPLRNPGAPMDPHGTSSEGFPVMRLAGDQNGLRIEDINPTGTTGPGEVDLSNVPPVPVKEGLMGYTDQLKYGAGEVAKDVASYGSLLGSALIPSMGYDTGPKRKELLDTFNKQVDEITGAPTDPDNFGESLMRNGPGYFLAAIAPGGWFRKAATAAGTALAGEGGRELAKQAGLPEWAQSGAAIMGAVLGGSYASSLTKNNPKNWKDVQKLGGDLYKWIGNSSGAVPKPDAYNQLLNRIKTEVNTKGMTVEGAPVLKEINKQINTLAARSGGFIPKKGSNVTLKEIVDWRSDIAKIKSPRFQEAIRNVVKEVDEFISKPENFSKWNKDIPRAIKAANKHWAIASRGEELDLMRERVRFMKGPYADQMKEQAHKILKNYNSDNKGIKEATRKRWSQEEIKLIEKMVQTRTGEAAVKIFAEAAPLGMVGKWLPWAGGGIAGTGATLGAAGAGTATAAVGSSMLQVAPVVVPAMGIGQAFRSGRNALIKGRYNDVLRKTLGEVPMSKTRKFAPAWGGAIGAFEGKNRK